eukprot:TRINITY_DN74065_c0_g1_i1.p1 TRINITY_DN74065_c0_g1~~TRINITY_DN74065_c0_g1_i1.p1  ORF type:complete len:320 (-),score=39.35 TRINITY_DN74065_c0_g1_i1:34-993(-)
MAITHIACGASHTILLDRLGRAFAFGEDGYGKCTMPIGAWCAAAGGNNHTILLDTLGQVKAIGSNSSGQTDVPPLAPSQWWVAVAGGGLHTVLLRSDGVAVAFGCNEHGQCDVPPGMYTSVAAGLAHTVLLREDGTCTCVGRNRFGECNVPMADAGKSYIGVAAGWEHTVLRQTNGCVVAFGRNTLYHNGCPEPSGQCELPSGSFASVSGGGYHTALLSTSGDATVVGGTRPGKLAAVFPRLPPRRRYVALATGQYHSMALRDDGAIFGIPHGNYYHGHDRRQAKIPCEIKAHWLHLRCLKHFANHFDENTQHLIAQFL